MLDLSNSKIHLKILAASASLTKTKQTKWKKEKPENVHVRNVFNRTETKQRKGLSFSHLLLTIVYDTK